MILLLHIIAALTSLVYTTYLCLRPSRRKLHVSYGLIGLTLASGTYLVISTHSPVLPSCTSGLFYLILVAAGNLAATRKLTGAQRS